MLYGTDIALGCGALTLLIALFGLGVPAPKPAAESDKETLLENGGPSTGTTPAPAEPKVKVSFKTFAVMWVALSMVPPLVCYQPFATELESSFASKALSVFHTSEDFLVEYATWVPPDARIDVPALVV